MPLSIVMLSQMIVNFVIDELQILPGQNNVSNVVTEDENISFPNEVKINGIDIPAMIADLKKSDNKHAFALLAYALSIHPNAEEKDPLTWKEARSSRFNHEWLEAERIRLEELKRNNVYTLVQRPTDRKAITVKPVYKTKFHPDGTFDKRSLRLAARGFQQIAGIDFYDVFSPVASYPYPASIYTRKEISKLLSLFMSMITYYSVIAVLKISINNYQKHVNEPKANDICHTIK